MRHHGELARCNRICYRQRDRNAGGVGQVSLVAQILGSANAVGQRHLFPRAGKGVGRHGGVTTPR